MKQGKWKSDTKVSREELAVELEELAAQLRQERFGFQEMEFYFHPEAAIEKRLAMKDGRLQLDVRISIRAASGHQGLSREGPDTADRAAPFARKKLKKPLSAAWKAMKRDIEGGGELEPGVIEELLSLMERYGRAADRAWLDEWERCAALVRKCIEAVSAGDRERALAFAVEVDILTKQCHKRFK